MQLQGKRVSTQLRATGLQNAVFTLRPPTASVCLIPALSRICQQGRRAFQSNLDSSNDPRLMSSRRLSILCSAAR